ncbi:hypothetical protein D3C75_952300 [compost metagenome]
MASICLIRSRVTPNTWPTSSRVRVLPSSNPKRSRSTFSSRSVSVSSTSSSCSFRSLKAAESAGANASLSSIKSPRRESFSSPMGVSRDTGSWPIFLISWIFSTVTPISLAISSSVGSRPRSCSSWRDTRTNLFSVSTICTGIRMVRAWSAMARVIACLIHHVA